jgi:hypothetical protein
MKIYAITKFAKEMLEIADNLGKYQLDLLSFFQSQIHILFYKIGMALKTSAKKYEDTNDDLYEGMNHREIYFFTLINI